MSTYLNKIVLSLSIGLSFFSSAKAQQDKNLPDFTQISAGQEFDIQLFPANRHAVYIEAGDKEVKAEVDNGTLRLTVGKDKRGPVKVKVYFRQLNGLQLDGAAKVSCQDTLVVPQFSITASGVAKVKLIISSSEVKADADGASDLTLAGVCSAATYKLSGTSSLKAYDLASQKVIIICSGAANGKVSASETLSANADGVSHISFTGNPVNKNIAVDGIATVKDKTEGDEFNNEITHRDKRDDDTTRLKIGKRKFIIIDGHDDHSTINSNNKRRMKRVWSGFETGVQGFVTPEMNFNMNNQYKYLNTKVGSSWFFGLNLPEIDGHIIRNKLAVTTGFGIQWSNIHFDGNTYLTPNIDSALTGTPSGTALSLNKLYTFDLTAPLLIKFAPGSKKRASGGFHIAAGAIIHYIATSRVTTESSAGGFLQHTELEDDFNINPFRADATVRIGYDKLKFFANYSLTPYFNSSKAPDIRLFSAGLTLVGF